MVSNFSFCHNIFKSRLLQRHQKASVWWGIKKFSLWIIRGLDIGEYSFTPQYLSHYWTQPYVVRTQKNCLCDTILLSTNNIAFGCQIRISEHKLQALSSILDFVNVQPCTNSNSCQAEYMYICFHGDQNILCVSGKDSHYLTLSHLWTHFDAFAADDSWKLCAERRKCSKQIFSPFVTMFSTFFM